MSCDRPSHTSESWLDRLDPNRLGGPRHVGLMAYIDGEPSYMSWREKALFRGGDASRRRAATDGTWHRVPLFIVGGSESPEPHTGCADLYWWDTALCGERLTPACGSGETTADAGPEDVECAVCLAAVESLDAKGMTVADVDPTRLPIDVDGSILARITSRLQAERAEREQERDAARDRERRQRWSPVRRALPADSRWHLSLMPLSRSLCGADTSSSLVESRPGPYRGMWRPTARIFDYDPAAYTECRSCEEAAAWVRDSGLELVDLDPWQLPIVPPARYLAASHARAAEASRLAAEAAQRDSERLAAMERGERERIERLGWTFAEGEDLVYGTAGLDEGWVVVPREDLTSLIALRDALGQADTWGALRRRLDGSQLEEVRQHLSDRSMAERGLSARDPLESVPDDLEVYIESLELGGWPGFPEDLMNDWLPVAILAEFGVAVRTHLDGDWFVVSDMDGLREWLERSGARCTRDDDLLARAYQR